MSTVASARFPALPVPRPITIRGAAPPGQETRRLPVESPWPGLRAWLLDRVRPLRRLAERLGLVRRAGEDRPRWSDWFGFRIFGGLAAGLGLALIMLPAALVLGVILRSVSGKGTAPWVRSRSGPERARS